MAQRWRHSNFHSWGLHHHRRETAMILESAGPSMSPHGFATICYCLCGFGRPRWWKQINLYILPGWAFYVRARSIFERSYVREVRPRLTFSTRWAMRILLSESICTGPRLPILGDDPNKPRIILVDDHCKWNVTMGWSTNIIHQPSTHLKITTISYHRESITIKKQSFIWW